MKTGDPRPPLAADNIKNSYFHNLTTEWSTPLRIRTLLQLSTKTAASQNILHDVGDSTAACRVTMALASVIVLPTTGWCYIQDKTIELWKTESHMQSCCTQSWWWSFSQSLRSTWSLQGKSKSDLHLNTWRKGREGRQKWLGPAEIKLHPLANNPPIYYSCSQNQNKSGGKSPVKILDKRKVHLESFFDSLHQLL